MDQIVRSITVGKDEGHVVHLLLWEIFYLRLIVVHLKDARDGADVRFRRRNREEKQLRSERGQNNGNRSDNVMRAHESISTADSAGEDSRPNRVDCAMQHINVRRNKVKSGQPQNSAETQ